MAPEHRSPARVRRRRLPARSGARRQIDLAPRADARGARGRAYRDHRAARGRGRACAPRPRCARWAPGRAAGGGRWQVDGVGVGGLAEAGGVLDLGNSGTAARLLLGVAGDAPVHQLCDRRRVVAQPADATGHRAAVAFGARFTTARGRQALPLAVTGAANPVPIEYTLPVPSAQVKSAVLLAGLNTPGETTVVEPQPTRDHTERMLGHFGATVRHRADRRGRPAHHRGWPARTHCGADRRCRPTSRRRLSRWSPG
jgi:hypothetical protein